MIEGGDIDYRFRDVFREKEWWFLAALVAMVFIQPLTTQTFFFRDLYQTGLPKKEFFAAAIRAAQFPMWDPLVHGGQPYLASPANAAFYPATLLFLVLPPLIAFNLSLVAHFVLCAFGAYWLARLLGMSAIAAAASGVAYSLAGPTLSTGNFPIYLFAIGWIPIAIGLALRYFVKRRLTSVSGAIIAAALPAIAGGAEAAIMLFITLAIVAFAAGLPGVRWKRLVTVAIIAAAAAALSMIQTLPALEMVSHSSRGTAPSYASFVSWSVSPRRMPELVVPHLFGHTASMADEDYWGFRVEDAGFPYFLSIYFGVACIALAFAGTMSAKSRPLFPRRAMAALAVIATILTLGRFLPIFPLLFRIPLLSLFRYPVKAFLIVTLPVALLAGNGIDAMMESRARRRAAVVAVTLTIPLIALAAAIEISPRFAVWMTRLMFLQALDGMRSREFAETFIRAAAFSTAAIALLLLDRIPMARLRPLLTALIAIDLATAGFTVNAYATRDLFIPPQSAGLVRSVVDGGRLYRTLDNEEVWIKAPSNDIQWLARFKMETLSGYTSTMFGIPAIFHVDYDRLAPIRIAELANEMFHLPWPRRLPILRAAGVRTIMTYDDVTLPGVKLLYRSRSSAGILSIYSLDNSPMARFVSRTEVVDLDAILNRMTAGLDLDRILLTSGRSEVDCGTAPVMVEARSLNEARYSVAAPCAGFVYFAEPFYPGWEVFVDGRKGALVDADYAFSAVNVPPGRHTIVRRYRPWRIPVGIAISALTLLVLLMLTIVDRRRIRAAAALPAE